MLSSSSNIFIVACFQDYILLDIYYKSFICFLTFMFLILKRISVITENKCFSALLRMKKRVIDWYQRFAIYNPTSIRRPTSTSPGTCMLLRRKLGTGSQGKFPSLLGYMHYCIFMGFSSIVSSCGHFQVCSKHIHLWNYMYVAFIVVYFFFE